MKFLGRLLLWQKFAILGALALFAAGIPFFLFYQSQQATYDFTASERAGLQPAAALMSVYELNAQHRGLSASFLGGNESAGKERAVKQDELDRAVNAADGLYKEYFGSNERMVMQWEQVKKSWREIAVAVSNKTITQAQSFERHTNQANDIMLFMERLLGYSKMELDPYTETYSMIQSAFLLLPTMAEDMGQVRGKGAGMISVSQLNKQSVPIADRLGLSSINASILKNRAVAKRRIDVAFEARPELRNSLEVQVATALEAGQRTHELAQREVIDAEMPNMASLEYFRQQTTSIDEVFKAIKLTINQLDVQFARQLQAARATQWRITGFVTVMILVAAGLGLLIARGITQPAQHLVNTMIKIAQGDKRARVRTENTDELGLLGRQFDVMVDEREAVTQ
jgi:twitching motility protein PilJ